MTTYDEMAAASRADDEKLRPERMAARAEGALGALREVSVRYEAHPLAARFPMMSDDRLAHLAELIKAHGLRDPITLFESKILDGRNRDRACEIAGVEPRYVEFQGDDPAAFVLDKNIGRRDLTDDQRAAIIVDLLPLIEEEVERTRRRKQGQTRTGLIEETSPPQVRNPTRRVLAERAQVSTAKIKQATALKRADSPALREVRDGTMKLKDAASTLQSRGPAPAIPGASWGSQRVRRSNNGPGDRVKQVASRYPTRAEITNLIEEIQVEHLDLSAAVLEFLVRHLLEAAGGREKLLRELKSALEDTGKDTP